MPTLADLAQRWSLRIRLLLFFLAIAFGGLALIGLGMWLGMSRANLENPASGFLIAGLVAGFGLLGLVAGIWLLFDENVAKPIARLAIDLRARTLAGVSETIDAEPTRYLGDLGGAASTLAKELADTRGALAEAVARETERIAAENLRLTAILRDVPAGVILCTSTHRIVLYNAQVVPLFAGEGEVGLDRKLFGLLREDPIRHAYDQLCRSAEQDKAVDLICATIDGGRVLHGQMRLVHNDGQRAAGYVLTLRDVTPDLNAHAGRERMLREIVEYVRRPAANLKTTLDVLAMPELSMSERQALQAAVIAEADALVSWIDAFGTRLDTARGGWWPMSDVEATDIAEALRQVLDARGIALVTHLEPLQLNCDGYAIAHLLAGASRHLLAGIDQLSLTIREEGEGAMIEIGFEGSPPSVTLVDQWLARPLSAGYGAVSGRDALDHHGSDFWPEDLGRGHAVLRMPIRKARSITAHPIIEPRPEFYDFDLLGPDASGFDDERPLDALSYVVFDTETTGLLPFKGDEIVQIAGFRIVNGRLLMGENFDMLVNPGRAIPPSSTRIHRITDDMVLDQPRIVAVSQRFHQFTQDAVLVAHNAPFDMAFLRRYEREAGVEFANPVLDTVLLSAMLFGLTAEHSLDALAARLGVKIAPEARHTGIGDAEATARIFLKMIPLLKQSGIVTLSQTLHEFRKYRRLLRSAES
ncbi:3'-5' exonuclease [Pelagibacterium luteolum]|uniref:DNA-directed DNA polymerase n=1 Tax=Pelagibacterium luteolum TaxID=440168 RepID=A0A1G7S6E2_9HYPH|nr:exonuclease domain-containing protein [Pelagibacterium luteolum]SDG18551.1 DNA polymerase-3 subunit epsilon [Pelagibacterium luteolum]